VQVDVGVDAGRMDDRGDGQHDDGRQEPLHRAESTLESGRARWDRRLDSVLDLAGEAELLGEGIATAWMPWNMIEMPTTRDEHGGEVGLRPWVGAPPMPWPIFGKTKRKTKQSKKGCTRTRMTNSTRCLRSTPGRAAPGRRGQSSSRLWRAARRRADLAQGALVGSATVAISPAAPFRSDDEHVLEAGLGDGEVGDIEAGRLGGGDHARTSRSAPFTCSSMPPSTIRVRGDSLDRLGEARASASGHPPP